MRGMRLRGSPAARIYKEKVRDKKNEQMNDVKPIPFLKYHQFGNSIPFLENISNKLLVNYKADFQ
jgi:hypothetical protein